MKYPGEKLQERKQKNSTNFFSKRILNHDGTLIIFINEENKCDTHTYLQTAVNVKFTQMQATKGQKLFGESDVEYMIKEPKKQIMERIPGNDSLQQSMRIHTNC